MHPIFSIVIPTYNRASLLQRCLESLVNQTFKNFEVIVCDDGSTDTSKDVSESFTGRLDIRYIWSENWGGPARPRNIGIKNSRSEWICFLDSDDWWHPDKLAMCIPYLDQFDIISHAMMRSTEMGFDGVIQGRQLNPLNPTIDLLLYLNNIPLSSQVIRKSLLNTLNGFSERRDLIGVEDYDFLIRSSLLKARFKHTCNILGYYWEPQSGGNISATSRQIRNEYNVYFTHRKQLSIRLQRDSWCHLNLRHGRRHYRSGRYQLANKSLNIALRTTHLKYILFAVILRIMNSSIFPCKISKIFKVRI